MQTERRQITDIKTAAYSGPSISVEKREIIVSASKSAPQRVEDAVSMRSDPLLLSGAAGNVALRVGL